MPRWLSSFSRWLEARGGEFCAGGRVTVADATMFDVLENTSGAIPGSLDAYPVLRSFMEKFAAKPLVAAYLAGPRFAAPEPWTYQ